FLFVFLPLALAAFFVTPRALRVSMLVVASWIFYAWGEKQIVVLLALSAASNWVIALAIERATTSVRRRLLLTLGNTVNIGALVYFKYTNFFVNSGNALLGAAGISPIVVAPVHDRRGAHGPVSRRAVRAPGDDEPGRNGPHGRTARSRAAARVARCRLAVSR